MDEAQMNGLAERFLDAWNSQEVERVVAAYADDLVYRDPNTRGEITDPGDMRRYLTKLFAAWNMRWSLREAHLFEGEEGGRVPVARLDTKSGRREDGGD
ncbi:MAG: nuclear transport factor 2 family protein [bacterium]